jgi:hypothetical protein
VTEDDLFPLQVTGAQMDTILGAMKALPEAARREFLIDIACELDEHRNALGEGLVARIARAVQRKHAAVEAFSDRRGRRGRGRYE